MSTNPADTLTDSALLAELGGRLTRFRLRANLTQGALAREAGISKRTLERIENGEAVQLISFVRACRALGLLDDIDRWVPEPAPSPIDELRLQGRERQRASSASATERSDGPGEAPEPWAWGDEP